MIEGPDLDEHRRSRESGTLDWLYRVFQAGTVLMVAVAIVEIALHRVTVWFVVESIATTATTVLLRPRFAPPTRATAVVCGMTTIACMAMFQFGPMLGTGVFFALAASAATFFFGARGAVVSCVVLTLGMATVAITTTAGWVAVHWPQPQLLAWLRMGISGLLGIAALAALFVREQLLSRRSVERYVAALRSEREAEAERARMLQIAMTSQRLESLGRLAGGVAHDFNNALTVIRSGADLLKIEDDETARAEILDDILRATRGAQTTARQLLAFSRRVPDPADSCQPDEVVKAFGASMARVLPASIRVAVDAHPTPRVAVARAVLEQALLNLVLNARDAMSKGGHLALRTRGDGADVVIEVEDDGLGMDEAVRARVFEPFFSTKEDGTGLGLAVVWGVATRAGGSVEVDSAVGRGTRLRVRLPATDASATSGEEIRVIEAATPARILLLEDYDEVRRSMERTLRHAGHTVTSTATAAAAATALADGAFDLLITDGIVPGGGVAELVAAFRRAFPDAPILVCSGHLPEDVAPPGMDRRELAFLGKPFEMAELLRVVAELRTRSGARAAPAA